MPVEYECRRSIELARLVQRRLLLAGRVGRVELLRTRIEEAQQHLNEAQDALTAVLAWLDREEAMDHGIALRHGDQPEAVSTGSGELMEV